MTEHDMIKDRLDKIQARLVAAGYVDVKVFLSPGATFEQAAHDLAEALEAMLDGRARPAPPCGDSVNVWGMK